MKPSLTHLLFRACLLLRERTGRQAEGRAAAERGSAGKHGAARELGWLGIHGVLQR